MEMEIFIDNPKNLFRKSGCVKKNNDWRRCKSCGKYISFKQIEQQTEVRFHFIPDTEFTIEEAYWIHKKCD